MERTVAQSYCRDGSLANSASATARIPPAGPGQAVGSENLADRAKTPRRNKRSPNFGAYREHGGKNRENLLSTRPYRENFRTVRLLL